MHPKQDKGVHLGSIFQNVNNIACDRPAVIPSGVRDDPSERASFRSIADVWIFKKKLDFFFTRAGLRRIPASGKTGPSCFHPYHLLLVLLYYLQRGITTKNQLKQTIDKVFSSYYFCVDMITAS